LVTSYEGSAPIIRCKRPIRRVAYVLHDVAFEGRWIMRKKERSVIYR
jgi:hypothetical protein